MCVLHVFTHAACSVKFVTQIESGSRASARADDRNGWTPLHWAAQFGHFEVCELLIANVIERNPEDIRGVTPLHSAASNGHIEVCELIIQVCNV